MKIIAIVQARMGSSRLPGKVMKEINGVPMIQILLERLKLSKKIDEIVVATTESKKDQEMVDYLLSNNFLCERGSEKNVLQRFIDVSNKYNADYIVRITGDCPLIDPALVDIVISELIKTKADYCTNTMPPTFPDGLDVEVFSAVQLEQAQDLCVDNSDIEHVTPSIRRREDIRKKNIENPEDLSSLRWTVDELSDFEVVTSIFNFFHPRIDFSWQEIMEIYESNKDIFKKNDSIKRNEGIEMNQGQKLWKRAKTIIPGGNMLLSKRSEMFLPDKWPSYFSKSKGCKVWDLDGNEFFDVSIMGIGTNTLGYGNDKVDEAVKNTIAKGNMSTLNCPEEVHLAERLIEINPWAEMVRFSRSGGEANSIAIRIARAASGKDNVAICGYHGWHDWYIAVNHSSENGLDSHLLPGLNPSGVPQALSGTVFPFQYNNFKELEDIVSNNDIGVIKMEVIRNETPKNNFLSKVRKLADERGIVLVFDECTSGFRETFGGIHKKFNITPDIAMYGKTLGNGYAINAIVGKKEIMEAAQTTFISSTFWTERIGPTAALKTLEVMEEIESWKRISDIGRLVSKNWQKLAKKYELEIAVQGIDALPSFSFSYSKNLEYKTLITQELLKQGYLATTSFYACTEHTTEILDGYFSELEKVFLKIKECEDGQNIYDLLEGPVCHSGFARLN